MSLSSSGDEEQWFQIETAIQFNLFNLWKTVLPKCSIRPHHMTIFSENHIDISSFIYLKLWIHQTSIVLIRRTFLIITYHFIYFSSTSELISRRLRFPFTIEITSSISSLSILLTYCPWTISFVYQVDSGKVRYYLGLKKNHQVDQATNHRCRLRFYEIRNLNTVLFIGKAFLVPRISLFMRRLHAFIWFHAYFFIIFFICSRYRDVFIATAW